MHTATTSPTGYPDLGLTGPWPVPGTAAAAAAAVHRFETGDGGRFTVRGFRTLPVDVAAELTAVYAALRLRWPTVRPDRLAVTGDLDPGTLGQAWAYHHQWPEAHRHLRQRDRLPGRRRLAVTAVTGGAGLAAAVRRGDVVDATRTGTLELGRWVADEAERRAVAAYWSRSDAARRRHGNAPRSAPVAVSVHSAVLIHEFGHLAEAELLSLGAEATVDVYGTLSAAVHGTRRAPGVTDGRHLAGFPRTGAPGDAAGAEAVAALLGAYAATDRGELFAEAFLHAHAAADDGLRRRLAPFRHHLARTLAQGSS